MAADAFFGIPFFSMDHFFTTKYIRLTAASGIIESCGNFLAAAAGSYLLSIVVEKSKKCVDFTFTLYFIDILICAFYKVIFIYLIAHIYFYLILILLLFPAFFTVMPYFASLFSGISVRVGVVVDTSVIFSTHGKCRRIFLRG